MISLHPVTASDWPIGRFFVLSHNGVDDAYDVKRVTDPESGRELLKVVDEKGTVVVDPATQQPLIFDAEDAKARYTGSGKTYTHSDGTVYFRSDETGRMEPMLFPDGTPMKGEAPLSSPLGPMSPDDVAKLYNEYLKNATMPLGMPEWMAQQGIRKPGESAPKRALRQVAEGTPGARKGKTSDGSVGWFVYADEAASAQTYPLPDQPREPITPVGQGGDVEPQEPRGPSDERRAELKAAQERALAAGSTLRPKRDDVAEKRERNRQQVLEQFKSVFENGSPEEIVEFWIERANTLEDLLRRKEITPAQFREAQRKATAAHRQLRQR